MCRDIIFVPRGSIPPTRSNIWYNIDYSFLKWRGRYDGLWMAPSFSMWPFLLRPYLDLKTLHIIVLLNFHFLDSRLDIGSASSSLSFPFTQSLHLYSSFEWIQFSTTYCPSLSHFTTKHHGIQSAQFAVSPTNRWIGLSSTIYVW